MGEIVDFLEYKKRKDWEKEIEQEYVHGKNKDLWVHPDYDFDESEHCVWEIYEITTAKKENETDDKKD